MYIYTTGQLAYNWSSMRKSVGFTKITLLIQLFADDIFNKAIVNTDEL